MPSYRPNPLSHHVKSATRICASRHRLALSSAVVAACTLSAIPAHQLAAAEPSPQATALEEIVVTARRRAESLQDTPIAVSAFSGRDLEQKSLNNLMDIAGFAPNVSVSAGASSGGGSNSSSIYIRGVGQTEFLATSDPGVGIYVDGIYLPRSVGSVLDLLDLERVEVLRGPQGTLFGKNTIGGAINVVSTRPGETLGGYGEVTVGRFNRRDFRGSMDVPLIDGTLFARASVLAKRRDGHVSIRDFDIPTATPGREIDTGMDEDKLGARLALRWLPSADVSVDLVGDYTKGREKSIPMKLLAYTGGGQGLGDLWNGLVGIPAGTPMSTDFITGSEDVSYGPSNNVSDIDQWGLALTIEWDMGWATLKSITGARGFDATFGRDGDGTPIVWGHTLNDQEQDQISQEFQLSGMSFNNRLQWLAGVFYFEEKNTDRNEVLALPGLYDALEGLPAQIDGNPCGSMTAPGCPGNPINALLDIELDVFNRIEGESWAVFGQATYDLTEKWRVTAGLRYTYETKDYELEHRRMASGTFAVPYTKVDDDWSAFTPMVSTDYQLSESMMVYASVSRGFKSGGFNGRPLDGVASVQSFDPEYVLSYEVGMKSEFMERRVRVNAAAFYSDYSDMQFTANVFNPDTGGLVQTIDNVGEATISGAELEVMAVPGAGLELMLAAGYTHFDITDLDADVPGVTKSSKQPRTPRWTLSAGAAYSWNWGNGEFTLRGDWAFESGSYADIQNTAELERQSHGIFNARLQYELPASGWEFALFGTNLTDKRYLVNGLSTLDSFGHVEGYYNRPREWGASVRKSF